MMKSLRNADVVCFCNFRLLLLFSVARSAMRMQETRFQIYLAQQHIEDINYNRSVVLPATFIS